MVEWSVCIAVLKVCVYFGEVVSCVYDADFFYHYKLAYHECCCEKKACFSKRVLNLFQDLFRV